MLALVKFDDQGHSCNLYVGFVRPNNIGPQRRAAHVRRASYSEEPLFSGDLILIRSKELAACVGGGRFHTVSHPALHIYVYVYAWSYEALPSEAACFVLADVQSRQEQNMAQQVLEGRCYHTPHLSLYYRSPKATARLLTKEALHAEPRTANPSAVHPRHQS